MLWGGQSALIGLADPEDDFCGFYELERSSDLIMNKKGNDKVKSECWSVAVKKYRLCRGLTVKEIQKSVGVSGSTICRIDASCPHRNMLWPHEPSDPLRVWLVRRASTDERGVPIERSRALPALMRRAFLARLTLVAR